MTRIGFIGTGIMGCRMVANLQKAGHELIIHNRTQEKAQSLLDNGAIWANSPSELAQEIDILFTMLAHPQAVTETALGDSGFLNTLPKNALWIDCSTVKPSFSREMASEAQARNIRFLDAPVGGSKNQAQDAVLVFIVGGNATDVEQACPLFEVMGSKVVHVGENGMGTALKVVINLQLGLSMAAFAEGLALGESLGISQETLLNVLVGGPVVAPFLASKRAKIENSDYEAEFPLKWLQKDLQMASEAAYEANAVLSMGNNTKELYQQATKQGLGDCDFSAIYQFLQSN